MKIEPLSKELFNEAIRLGIYTITLNFSGGSDEGYLDIDIVPDNSEFEKKVELWAWEVYSYSGAGEGYSYGDTIEYDIENMKSKHSDWYYERTEGDESIQNIPIEE